MNSRIAIVGGGGGVGASLAFNLLLAETPYEVALVDGRSGMARSHEMDLQQVVAQGASGSVEIVELGTIADADVVVISASVPLTVNDSRMVYLRDNAAIVAEIGDALPDGWPGVLVMVTNPVDPLCTLLWRRRGAVERFVRHWYERHVALDSGRSSTWTTGRGLARMIAALAGDEGELWPASVVLEGEYGVSDAALTVPVTLGRGGVRELHEWELSEEQRGAMGAAGEAVRTAAARLTADCRQSC